MKLGAVITAAGLSSRMGAFKPLLPLGNSTIIGRIINTLQKCGVVDIAVITGRDAALIKQALEDYNLIFIHNEDYAGTDMFYSASLGLKFMADRVEGIFFTPADTPLFNAATVRLLTSRIQTCNDHILTPTYHCKPGHPVVIRSIAVKGLINGISDNGLRGAMDAYCGPKGIIEVDDPGILYDSDTPEDYKFLIRHFTEGTAPY